LPESLAAVRRYSLALAVGMVIAAAALPLDVWRGSGLLRTPVMAPMIVNGSMAANPVTSKALSYRISLEQPMPAEGSSADTAQILVIDGNRNGRLVAFPHEFHCDKLGGKDSCVQCHHRDMPFDKNTSCYKCHRDMYLTTDIFNHSAHIAHLDGNSGCGKCHMNAAQAKTRKTAMACGECHREMPAAKSVIPPPKGETDGQAAGYMEAMHRLCITCHEKKLAEDPQHYRKSFADCTTCHRDINGAQLRRMSPYVARESGVISLPKKAEANQGGPKS
jgi:hypothetical protein